MRVVRPARRKREEGDVDDFARDGRESARAEPGHDIPFTLYEQALAQLLVRVKEQPVLRRHQSRAASWQAEVETTLDKASSEVGPGLGVNPFAVALENPVLPAAPEVGH